ncbi:hypothetical protein ABMA27_008789 [Loxostege sticticalis]|uniref:Uncharacterized protein n=1 Tax=Loxostege sticticalis TaxID=481309 RepID=A0ABR3H8V1_LOXSC
MTSEYLHAYDTSIDDESGERSVCVLLAGEESEITFLDSPPDHVVVSCAHGYCVVYSTADRDSLAEAERRLQTLWAAGHTARRAVILVGNKADLARSRVVPTDGEKRSGSRKNRSRARSPLETEPPPPAPPATASANSTPRKRTRLSASVKVRGLLGRVWARDSKSKSCENLHVL